MQKLKILIVVVALLFFNGRIYACSQFVPANRATALLHFLKNTPTNIVIGKVVSATGSTVSSIGPNGYTTFRTIFQIQFRVEKIIKGHQTIAQTITIEDESWWNSSIQCFSFSKLATANEGRIRIDTNKFIVILDTSRIPKVQPVWWDGYLIVWSQESERQVDSLSKLATTTNVAEQRKDVGFEVYPNPSQTRANIRYQMQQSGAAHVEISNYQGQVVQSLELFGQAGENTQELSVNGLANGVYFCRIRTQAGM